MDDVSVRALAARARDGRPRLGATRLVLIDGPAGAGKTTLAARLADALDGHAQVLHADDMYEGWDGLEDVDSVLVDQVLEPLAAGLPGSFRRWDWHAGRRDGEIEVSPGPFLLVEGVGMASRRARSYAALVIWVDAPRELRLRRGIERDGESMRAEWERWLPRESVVHEREGTRAGADVHVDGSAPIPP